MIRHQSTIWAQSCIGKCQLRCTGCFCRWMGTERTQPLQPTALMKKTNSLTSRVQSCFSGVRRTRNPHFCNGTHNGCLYLRGDLRPASLECIPSRGLMQTETDSPYPICAPRRSHWFRKASEYSVPCLGHWFLSGLQLTCGMWANGPFTGCPRTGMEADRCTQGTSFWLRGLTGIPSTRLGKLGCGSQRVALGVETDRWKVPAVEAVANIDFPDRGGDCCHTSTRWLGGEDVKVGPTDIQNS